MDINVRKILKLLFYQKKGQLHLQKMCPKQRSVSWPSYQFEPV